MAQPLPLGAGLATLEPRTQVIGRELYERVKEDRRGFFETDRWTGLMFDWAMGMEQGKLQLFRFVDVLPALEDDADVTRHLREYFHGRNAPFAALVRLALGVAQSGWLGDTLVAAVLRRAVRHLARRFIAGTTSGEVLRAVRGARASGQTFTVDVLGEACVSDEEAFAYQRRYLELIERLGADARRWTRRPTIDEAPWGPLPRVNISVKLSALDPYLDPIDPDRGSAVARERLRPIVRAALAHDAHIQVDMEERRLKDLTLAIFTELCDEAEFRGAANLGIVLQAYLRDAEADARRLIAWARRRGTPVTVRLVKGAYWDYETAHAALERWPVPVWEEKSETDAAFERLTELFMDAPDAVRLAVASHNVRSIARALALRERFELAQGQLEFQALYGMAGPLARALTERGERVRIYMPFGELIPGMGYLVRRLLENTSNESFLRRGFRENEPVERLLADPAAVARAGGERSVVAAGPPSRGRSDVRETVARGASASVDASPSRDVALVSPPVSQPAGGGAERGFVNEPHTDFSIAAARERFAAAIAKVRAEHGRHYPLVIGGGEVDTADRLTSLNPSRPAEVVGTSASASAEDVDRAVAAAERAFPAWRDLGVAERSDVLGRVAGLMRASRAELAAWMVHEAGKPWREADADVAEAIDFLEYYRRQAADLLQPLRLGRLPGEVNHYRREPRGVVAVIAPWNFPLAILTGMASAALATGNTVVMKPAEQTPVIAAKLMEAFVAAGVPPGVVNYVPGLGDVAGDRMVHHPSVRVIAFTGSLEIGTRIYAAAAQLAKGGRHLKRVVAEMGGKNAIVVDDDADLDETVQGIVTSAFGYAGQKCSACSRVIAVGGVYERLLERLAEAARGLPMGPADEPATVVGPVIDAASAERIGGYVELGKRLGRPVLMRDVLDHLRALGGSYAAPAIFADVPPACSLAQEEIFGPVLSVLRAGTFDEAIELAMGLDYALTGGVFSRSPARLAIARERFRVGDLYINRGITGAMVARQPFGGRQLSGVGYQAGGPDYLLQFIEARTITENTLRRGFASDSM